MAVKDFHIFHGVVLARLLRNERPVSLRLIETKPSESWSTYTLNDAIDLFVAHSTSAREYERDGGGHSWTFSLSPNQVRQIRPDRHVRDVYVALVCATRDVLAQPMVVCVLSPDQTADLFDGPVSVAQSITVRKPAGKGRLRVMKDRYERYKIAESFLDDWDIPGS